MTSQDNDAYVWQLPKIIGPIVSEFIMANNAVKRTVGVLIWIDIRHTYN